MSSDTMAMDNYGQTFHGLGPHPRKELMARLGYKSATRIFRDKLDGTSVHVGWKIGPHWLTVYKVEPWEQPR